MHAQKTGQSLAAPMSGYLKPSRRLRGKVNRVQLQKQMANLKKELKDLQAIGAAHAANQHEKQRHKMLNTNPLCSRCSCEMTIRRRQKNTARLIDGKLICETCVQWERSQGEQPGGALASLPAIPAEPFATEGSVSPCMQ